MVIIIIHIQLNYETNQYYIRHLFKNCFEYQVCMATYGVIISMEDTPIEVGNKEFNENVRSFDTWNECLIDVKF